MSKKHFPKVKKSVRLKVYAKFDGRCAYCGEHLEYKAMQVDHIISRLRTRLGALDKGALNGISNLNPSCRACNYYKSAAGIESFRKLMRGVSSRLKKLFLIKIALKYGIISFKEWDGLFYFEKQINEWKDEKDHKVKR